MLLAVHNGWHMHQLDRLKLWDGFSAAAQKRKAVLDELCSVENRFTGLLEEQAKGRAARCGGLIPCVFWFNQKAELLRETPRFSSDRSVNNDYLIAAWNVFGSLKEFQKMRYDENLKENEATYYFSQLMNRKPSDSVEEDACEMLYPLSDEIKSAKESLKPKRPSLASFFKRSSSRESSSSCF